MLKDVLRGHNQIKIKQNQSRCLLYLHMMTPAAFTQVVVKGSQNILLFLSRDDVTQGIPEC